MTAGAGWTRKLPLRQSPRMLQATTIWTVREQLEGGYSVRKYCPHCQKGLGELDLAGLVEAGYGDRPPGSLSLKCGKCKTRVLITIHPPKGNGGPVSPSVEI